jgi:Cu(I)-responsive transcriptional regulator
MNIGEASQASGVPPKTIRYYESIRLIRPATRSAGNYRVYSDADVHMLRFIRRARGLGFSVEETATLLGLWQNNRRRSADVKSLALRHVDDLNRKVDELQSMVRTLRHLAHCCSGDSRPDCPILDDLAQPEAQAAATVKARRRLSM